VSKKGHGPHQHGFGHHHGTTPQWTSSSVHVWGQINGRWYEGEMSFYPDGEVHLDPSAIHIGSLKHQNFVVHDGHRWLNMHVSHDHDGANHIWTTPIGDSLVPPWEEFLHPHTLPPLPQIHLPSYDPSSPDYDQAQGWPMSYDQSGPGEFGYSGSAPAPNISLPDGSSAYVPPPGGPDEAGMSGGDVTLTVQTPSEEGQEFATADGIGQDDLEPDATSPRAGEGTASGDQGQEFAATAAEESNHDGRTDGQGEEFATAGDAQEAHSETSDTDPAPAHDANTIDEMYPA
jgi:hypothetical protein